MARRGGWRSRWSHAADGASLACLRHSTVASVGPLLQCRMSGLRWEGMHVCDLAAATHFT